MTKQEAMEIIKVAISEIEWEYPMDYAVAFEIAIRSLEIVEKMQELIEKLEKMADRANDKFSTTDGKLQCYFDGMEDGIRKSIGFIKKMLGGIYE